MTVDPLRLSDDVDRATDRLLTTAAGLGDPSTPTTLPGWTVGHVLSHLARNADGTVNLLTWARTGEVRPQYESLAARAAGIEAGAHQPLPQLLADLRAACARVSSAVDAMPPEAWANTVRSMSGAELTATQVIWGRLKEVEVHHVDLGAGYTPQDWPAAFTLRMVRTLVTDLTARDDGPRLVIRAPEVGHGLTIGSGVRAPIVTGPAWAVVAWLIGRDHPPGLLTVEPEGSLPAVPAWG